VLKEPHTRRGGEVLECRSQASDAQLTARQSQLWCSVQQCARSRVKISRRQPAQPREPEQWRVGPFESRHLTDHRTSVIVGSVSFTERNMKPDTAQPHSGSSFLHPKGFWIA